MCGLTVKYQPFMSPATRDEQVALHHQLAKDGHPLHTRIKQTIAPVLMSHSKHKASDPRVWKGKRNVSLQAASALLSDYNTVESVLLYCAILVCLAGIMFTSGAMDERTMKGQKTFLTVAVMIVLVLSITVRMCVAVAVAVAEAALGGVG